MKDDEEQKKMVILLSEKELKFILALATGMDMSKAMAKYGFSPYKTAYLCMKINMEIGRRHSE